MAAAAAAALARTSGLVSGSASPSALDTEKLPLQLTSISTAAPVVTIWETTAATAVVGTRAVDEAAEPHDGQKSFISSLRSLGPDVQGTSCSGNRSSPHEVMAGLWKDGVGDGGEMSPPVCLGPSEAGFSGHHHQQQQQQQQQRQQRQGTPEPESSIAAAAAGATWSRGAAGIVRAGGAGSANSGSGGGTDGRSSRVMPDGLKVLSAGSSKGSCSPKAAGGMHGAWSMLTGSIASSLSSLGRKRVEDEALVESKRERIAAGGAGGSAEAGSSGYVDRSKGAGNNVGGWSGEVVSEEQRQVLELVYANRSSGAGGTAGASTAVAAADAEEQWGDISSRAVAAGSDQVLQEHAVNSGAASHVILFSDSGADGARFQGQPSTERKADAARQRPPLPVGPRSRAVTAGAAGAPGGSGKAGLQGHQLGHLHSDAGAGQVQGAIPGYPVSHCCTKGYYSRRSSHSHDCTGSAGGVKGRGHGANARKAQVLSRKISISMSDVTSCNSSRRVSALGDAEHEARGAAAAPAAATAATAAGVKEGSAVGDDDFAASVAVEVEPLSSIVLTAGSSGGNKGESEDNSKSKTPASVASVEGAAAAVEQQEELPQVGAAGLKVARHTTSSDGAPMSRCSSSSPDDVLSVDSNFSLRAEDSGSDLEHGCSQTAADVAVAAAEAAASVAVAVKALQSNSQQQQQGGDWEDPELFRDSVEDVLSLILSGPGAEGLSISVNLSEWIQRVMSDPIELLHPPPKDSSNASNSSSRSAQTDNKSEKEVPVAACDMPGEAKPQQPQEKKGIATLAAAAASHNVDSWEQKEQAHREWDRSMCEEATREKKAAGGSSAPGPAGGGGGHHHQPAALTAHHQEMHHLRVITRPSSPIFKSCASRGASPLGRASSPLAAAAAAAGECLNSPTSHRGLVNHGSSSGSTGVNYVGKGLRGPRGADCSEGGVRQVPHRFHDGPSVAAGGRGHVKGAGSNAPAAAAASDGDGHTGRVGEWPGVGSAHEGCKGYGSGENPGTPGLKECYGTAPLLRFARDGVWIRKKHPSSIQGKAAGCMALGGLDASVAGNGADVPVRQPAVALSPKGAGAGGWGGGGGSVCSHSSVGRTGSGLVRAKHERPWGWGGNRSPSHSRSSSPQPPGLGLEEARKQPLSPQQQQQHYWEEPVGYNYPHHKSRALGTPLIPSSAVARGTIDDSAVNKGIGHEVAFGRGKSISPRQMQHYQQQHWYQVSMPLPAAAAGTAHAVSTPAAVAPAVVNVGVSQGNLARGHTAAAAEREVDEGCRLQSGDGMGGFRHTSPLRGFGQEQQQHPLLMMAGRFARSTSPSSITSYNNSGREVSPSRLQQQHRYHPEQQQQGEEHTHQEQLQGERQCSGGASVLTAALVEVAAAAEYAGFRGDAGGVVPSVGHSRLGPLMKMPEEVSASQNAPAESKTATVAAAGAGGLGPHGGQQRVSSSSSPMSSGCSAAKVVRAEGVGLQCTTDGRSVSSPASPSRTDLASHPVAFSVLTG